MAKRLILVAFFAFVVGSILPSCTMGYSFTGANISPMVKTFTVYFFPNRARLINPTLSQSFTEELKDKLTRQTSLNEISENGDIEFEGQITKYELKPISVAKDDISAQTRLTIAVKVKYTNSKEPEKDFDQSFSAFEDFDSNLSLSSVEDELVLTIIEQLTDDIFNSTIADW